MRARLPWILFFVSLALNVSIIVGVLWVGHEKIFGAKRGLALVEDVAHDLNLSDAQETSLRELVRQSIEERKAAEQEGGRASDLLLAALQEQTLDADAVRTVMIERGQPWRERFIQELTRVHAFAWQLDERQRQFFFDRIAGDPDFLRRLLRPDRDK
jgi:hypothetical protein